MNVPEHIAIIMDGNGRWAKKRFLNKSFGHRAGAQNLKKLSNYAEKIGVKYMTVYAFSTENWKRSDDEVSDLMHLLREYIQDYIDDSENNQMKISAIGDLSRLDEDLQQKISFLVNLTKNKPGLNIIIALNYGGRDEIIRASKKMFANMLRNNIDVNNITESYLGEHLDTYLIPDPDLVIRTSGEQRLSNFLIWQTAYSELHFSQKLWPDFKEKDLDKAIEEYNDRERRFGGRL